MKVRYLLLLLCFAAAAHADSTTVSGSTFGTWTSAGNPYLLVGTIEVPFGRTLTIEPGVYVECFGEEHSLNVSGTLTAEGTAEEPITFTIDTLRWPGRWRGIRIATGTATLQHCIIENASYSSIGEQVACGVNCQGGSLTMSDCLVQRCKSHAPVGVYQGSTALIERCTIRYNQIGFGCCGGGIGVRGGSQADIVDCNIHNNSALDGGGIYVNDGSSANITGCEIADNVAQIWGGGIFAGGDGQVNVRRCFILDNLSYGSGGGIEARSYNLIVERCNFVGNDGGDGSQVHSDTSPVSFNSCIFAPFNGPFGGREVFSLTPSASIEYCSIYAYWGDTLFYGQRVDSLGEIVTTNANGDSCDAYFNVYSDPLFVNSFTDDWNLLPDSPCIDAGDPSLPLDPDSTTADMGVFYYSQTNAANPADPPLPRSAELHAAYPNPFNPSTTLSFTLSKQEQVRFQVVDLLGRTVAVLADGALRSGLHSYRWEPATRASGIYFAQLTAGDFSAVQKLILLK